MMKNWMVFGAVGLSLGVASSALAFGHAYQATTPAQEAKVGPMRHPLSTKVSATLPLKKVTIPTYGNQTKVHEHLDRDKLAADVETRVAQIAASLEREIVNMGDVPQFEIVPLNVTVPNFKLKQDYEHEHKALAYEVDHTSLSGKRLKVRTLCPTSGHCGLEDGMAWASRTTPSYNLVWNGTALPKFAPNGKLVALHDIDVELNEGWNKLEFWADGSGGVGGAPTERTILIHYTTPKTALSAIPHVGH